MEMRAELREIGVGVYGSCNAWTVTDDGARALLWDVSHATVVEVDLSTGVKTPLLRSSSTNGRAHADDAKICYCLFHALPIRQLDEHLLALFFNARDDRFEFTTFLLVVGQRSLIDLRTFNLSLSGIERRQLAYTQHKDANGCAQVIFYERVDTASTREGRRMGKYSTDSREGHLILCQLDGDWMRMQGELHGKLPKIEEGTNCWQLPFTIANRLHFLKLEHSCTYIASLPLWSLSTGKHLHDAMEDGWVIRRLSPHVILDHPLRYNVPAASPWSGVEACQSGVLHPEKKALWCSAWTSSEAYFAVAKKLDKREKRILVYIWRLDVSALQWERIESTRLELPTTTMRFSIRIGASSPRRQSFYPTPTIYFHYDNNTFPQSYSKLLGFFNIPPSPNSAHYTSLTHYSQAAVPTIFSLPDMICPVCLETYSDPRTLHCGHSLCYACLIKLRETEISGWLVTTRNWRVKCPQCRQITKSNSASGLPTNFALQDVIGTVARQYLELSSTSRRVFGAEMSDLQLSVEAAKQEFSSKVEESLNGLRDDIALQVDNCLVKGFRRYWLNRYNTRVMKLMKQLDRQDLSEPDKFGECTLELNEQLASLRTELAESIDAIRSKSKLLMELFCKRLIEENEEA